jgi:hypothetical protein
MNIVVPGGGDKFSAPARILLNQTGYHPGNPK